MIKLRENTIFEGGETQYLTLEEQDPEDSLFEFI